VVEAALPLRTRPVGLRATALQKSSTNHLQGLELLPAFVHYVAATQLLLDSIHSGKPFGERQTDIGVRDTRISAAREVY